MVTIRPLAVPLSLTLMAACASAPRPAIAPLGGARPQELRLVVEPLAGSRQGLEGRFEPAREGRPAVNVRVRWLTVPAEALAQAVGDPARSLFGVTCPRDQARVLVDALLAEDVGGVETSEMTLGLQADQEGYLAVQSQRAHVAGFDLVSVGGSVIADPRVEVAREGVLLQARATREPGAGDWTLALELTTVELDHPMDERTLELGGIGAPLTVQVPGGLVRRLRCGASPGADEALLIGGAALTDAPRTRGTPLVLIELDPLGPDGETIARR